MAAPATSSWLGIRTIPKLPLKGTHKHHYMRILTHHIVIVNQARLYIVCYSPIISYSIFAARNSLQLDMRLLFSFTSFSADWLHST